MSRDSDRPPGANPPELDVLRGALGDLRREIRARLPESFEAGSGGAADRDWIALFEELRVRMGNFWISNRSTDIDEFGMDAVAVEATRDLFALLYERYFRVEVSGFEKVPTGEPCLFAANRSGLLPYDGLMVSEAVQRLHPRHERPRFMVADWLVTLPFVQSSLARIGGVRACRENTDRLLRTGRSVVAFPEGVKGAAKVFRERYQLKRFGRGGVVRAAMDNDVPLVPVGIVGAEEAHPILFKSHTPARLMGLPFVPVTPTFPWLGPLGLLPLPTKWVVSFGEPIKFDRGGAPDAVQVSRVNEALRSRVQSLINEGLDQRQSVWE